MVGRKTWIFLLVFGSLTLGIVLSRQYWMPPQWNAYWHDTWLLGREKPLDPVDQIHQDHQRVLALIHNEYQEKIHQEKQIREQLLLQYKELLARQEQKQ